MSDYIPQLKELLLITVQKQASDLHISVDNFPTLRIVGRLVPLTEKKRILPSDAKGLASALMTAEQYQRFIKEKEIDFSYGLGSNLKFRVNIFFQKGNISIAFRAIPNKIKNIKELNLPHILYRFVQPSQGFVLVTGPSGHGKSTTLAALIDEINHTRFDHIITIENPIEYVFKDDKCIIDQREVFQDTHSFTKALKAIFRQDPDVIMVGEMRDPETIAIAISAAETGHLVFATLHTNSAGQSIHRIIDSFPSTQQSQVRAQLSGSLLGVISQRLVPGIKGDLVPACEIMIANSAIANLIRENKIHEIDFVIETSTEQGMISLNKSLFNLIKEGKISLNTALTYSSNARELRKIIG